MADHETIDSLYRRLRTAFREAGIDAPEAAARWILARRAGLSWADLAAHPERTAPAGCTALADEDARRHMAGEPLSRIYGERSFWTFDFLLSPDTLDPRPDSETLVDAALRACAEAPPQRILDLGTGTGCLLICLLHAWPAGFGLGVDRALGACVTAAANARRAGVSGRAAWVCGHWGDALAGDFDLIVSNPPYIRSGAIAGLDDSVKKYDPILALDGGADGLDALRDVIRVIKNRLTPRGRAFVEIGFDQAADSERLVGEAGLNHIRHHADSAGILRVVEMARGDK